MAFDRENLTIFANNVKSGAVIAKYIYVNQASDDVTAASYFSDLRLRAGDVIEVVAADGSSSTRFYVASVTGLGVVTLGGISTVIADGTALALADIIAFNTTAEAFSYTLPDGVEGQKIILVMTVDGGNNAVITPANLAAGATLTFADANDSCTMLFINSTWQITSLEGVVVG